LKLALPLDVLKRPEKERRSRDDCTSVVTTEGVDPKRTSVVTTEGVDPKLTCSTSVKAAERLEPPLLSTAVGKDMLPLLRTGSM
jgi:hypothetical protein